MQEAVSGISASADGAAVGIVVAKAIQMKAACRSLAPESFMPLRPSALYKPTPQSACGLANSHVLN
jgi:hypothetical protein